MINTIPHTKKTRLSKKHLQNSSLGLIAMILLQACISSSIPKKAKGIENACDILATDDSWEAAFTNTFKKYGIPPHVVMAIIYQESRFVSDARPPRKVVLGIPTVRPSNAYGYPQALDATWDWYKDKTGNSRAKRNHFPDAVDFVGWYLNENYKRTNVSKWNSREQYLAYHDGTGGYLKQTHLQKPWLLAVADKVQRHADVYQNQLQSCYNMPQS